MANEFNTEKTVGGMTSKTQVNWAGLALAGLGATKLAANAFGVPFISDDQINAVVNLIAVGVTIGGILINNFKK